ncbi:unnamed protein product [Adineta steineri]|uniref:Uncharacterized protein n=2 Tax=Adineta steineri TaxID=433720 RepID=A0A814V647_9BILA|nr:unnamed protein product [Adineta steineri]
MYNSHDKNIQPLHMLPRFNSRTLLNENILLPRFHSDHKRYYSYDENQSADTEIKIIPNEILETNYRSNKFHIKLLERAYDRSGKKCLPAINTNIGKLDLEYAYEIIGDTLESYIRYRKLDRCTALASFLDYRNKVYKREKIAQYALPKIKTHSEEIRPKQPINIPTKVNKIEEKKFTPISTMPSTISENIPSTFISSSSSVASELTPKISKEAFIPIPSPELLKSSTTKSVQRLNTPKKNNLNIPKKIPAGGNIKQTPSSTVKGQS